MTENIDNEIVSNVKTLTVKSAEKSVEFMADESELNKSILGDQVLNQEAEAKTANTAEKVLHNSAIEMLTMGLGIVPMSLHLGGLPNTASAWSPQACEKVAAAAIPLLADYSWGQKCIEFLSNNGSIKFIALGAALQPLAIASFEGYVLDMKINHIDRNIEAANEATFTDNVA